MFDCPFNDRMPGLLKLVGWPWRGLTTMPTVFGTGYPSIALPNGGTKVLTAVQLQSVGAQDFALPGDAILFRDPRAGTVERTTAEQDADALAGYQWLPYVIYPNWAGIVYGQRPQLNWIWHDGDINHGIRLSGMASARVSPLVIGRTQPLGQSVSLTRVGAYSSPVWSGTTALVVIDALPDGSRVLVGRYQRWQQFTTDDPAWLAPARIPLVELWEYRLAKSGSSIVGEYECIRTPTQIVGTVSSPPRGEETGLSVLYGIEWQDNGSTWTGEILEGGGFPQIGEWDDGYVRPNWSYSESGRLISAYYDASGAVVEIRMSVTVEDTFSHTFDHGATGTPAVADHVTVSGPETILSPGSYSMEVSYSNESSSVTTVQLRDGGALVSQAVLTKSATASLTYSATLEITEAGNTNTSTSSESYTGSMSLTIDGVTVESATGSEEFVAEGESYLRSVSHPTVSIPEIPLVPGVLFAIEPMRYSSQVHALAVRRVSPAQSWIGHACHRGSVSEGVAVVAGAISHLYGTQNPATGQALRDSTDPIVWI